MTLPGAAREDLEPAVAVDERLGRAGELGAERYPCGPRVRRSGRAVERVVGAAGEDGEPAVGVAGRGHGLLREVAADPRQRPARRRVVERAVAADHERVDAAGCVDHERPVRAGGRGGEQQDGQGDQERARIARRP